MRIIHGQGYDDKDRKEFIPLIFRNILLAVQIMAEAMATLKIAYEDDNNRVSNSHKNYINLICCYFYLDNRRSISRYGY